MPQKKKDPNEMNDHELLERVFPKRVVKAIEQAVGKGEKPADDPDKD